MGVKSWGLDIGAAGIRAVQLTRTWKGMRVTDALCLDLSGAPEGAGRSQIIQTLRADFLAKAKGGAGLVFSFPSPRTIAHPIVLPFQDRKKNLRVVKYAAEPLLAIPIDQVEVDFYQAPKKGGGKDPWFFAVRKDDLRERLSLVQEAGLDPESVIPEAVALFLAAKNAGETEAGCGLLLDCGREKTTMIGWQEGGLALVRSLPPVGNPGLSQGEEREAALGPELEATRPLSREVLEEALGRLADEVQRSLLAFEAGPPVRTIEKIYLTGDGLGLPGAEAFLGDFLKKPVTTLAGDLLGQIPAEVRSALAVALGAALWEFTAGMERIDFRQGEFASVKKARRTRTRWRLLGAYAGILLLLAVGVLGVNYTLQEKKYRELKAAIRKEFVLAQPEVKKIVNEAQQLKNAVAEERGRVDALGGLGGAGSALDVLRELSVMIEPAWKMRITEIAIGPEGAEVNGEADSFETVNRLKAKLDRSALYKGVELKTARASNLENVIEFKLQFKRGS